MVEQEAVNFEVAGSSPAVGAKMIILKDLRNEGLFVYLKITYPKLMVKNSSQNGSAHVVVIIILVVALLGALGFIFWQNFLKPPVNEVSKIARPSTAASSQNEEAKRETLSISEMGISIDTTNLSQHLRYSIEDTDGMLVAKLGTIETQDECKDGYLGSIVRIKGEIPQDAEPQYTPTENNEKFEYLLKQFDGYYLKHINAQNPCELSGGSLFPEKALSIEVGKAVKNLTVE